MSRSFIESLKKEISKTIFAKREKLGSIELNLEELKPFDFDPEFLSVKATGKEKEIIDTYLSEIDLQHPDRAAITQHEDWHKLEVELQALKESEFIPPGLYKNLFRSMMSPKPRLLKDVEKRNQSRNLKNQIKHISLKQSYMRGENSFFGKPDNFDNYVRYNSCNEKEIEKLVKNQKIFTKKRMTELAASINKRIKDLQVVDSFIGFKRINILDASIICAKMFGMKWHELNFITVPFNLFKTNYWISSAKKDSKDEIKKLLIVKDRKSAYVDTTAFQYQPRLYPLSKFEISKETQTLVENLDKISELNNKPGFDYYWILMPSIDINHPYFAFKDGWKINVRKGEELQLQTFTNEYEAAYALDKTLIKDEYFSPILLGEREGKCYFINFVE